MFHIKKNELYGDKDISDDEIKQINESLALKKDASSLANLHIKSLTNKSNHFYSEGNKNDYIENKYKGGTNLAQISLQGDLLYSGAGKDIVIGNSGYDIILGATGNDTLDGGEGNDILNGGADYDTYYIKDEDTIIDNDLKGEIYFGTKDDAQRVQYFIKINDNTWHSSDKDGKEDKKFKASRVGNDLKIWSLNNPEDIAVIKKYFRADLNSQNENTKAWTGEEKGSLGLKVVEEKKEEPQQPEKTTWDYDHSNQNIVYSYEAGGASAGVHVRGSDLRTSQFLGSRYKDTFVTGEGDSHIVNTMKGDDLVVGGGGNEYIRAGGNSYIQPDAEGKTGNGATVSGGSTEYLRAGGNSYIQSDAEGKTGDDDTVAGGGNTDLIAGGGGNDTLWADKRDSEAYKTPVRFNKDDWRGDWISGEFNNDTIHGSNREDLLFGGEGNDTVSGGAASDIILGDGSYFPSVRSRVNEGQELNIATGETYIVE